MAAFVIEGHPLNLQDVLGGVPAPEVDAVAAALRDNGVGATVNLTLSAPTVTDVQAADVFQ